MNPFVFHSPTKVTFGEHMAATVADVVKEFGGTRPFVVTDDFLFKSKILDPVFTSLAELTSGKTVIFSDVPPDSEVATVNAAAEMARQNGCDCVVAVGGGSAMDTAKVVNICLSMGGDLMEYQGLNNLAIRLKPLIAIPTTAGTGSEVSMVAMVKDATEHKKLLFGSRFLAPDAAILDPTLIVSLPPKLTAATGLDAVTHGIESFSSLIASSAFTESLCLQSLQMLLEFLPRATAHGDDLEARSATLVASTMAGVAFTNSGVGIVHALAHATGARYGTHHGATNSVLLPHGMSFNLDAIAARYATIARFLKLSDSRNDTQAAQALIKAIEGLSAKVGLPARLRDLGVPEFSNGQLDELADLASTDPAIMFNPKDSSIADIIGIYQKAY